MSHEKPRYRITDVVHSNSYTQWWSEITINFIHVNHLESELWLYDCVASSLLFEMYLLGAAGLSLHQKQAVLCDREKRAFSAYGW